MQNISAKSIGVAIAVFALIAAAAFLHFRGKENAPNEISSLIADNSQETRSPVQETVLPGVGWKTETNKKYGFSFQYSEDMKIGSVPSPEGTETIVVEKEKPFGFQIFISPYGEPALTVERIKINIPDILIEQSQEITVGGEPGLAFFSRDDSIGKTREAWFVHQGHLYQITAYAEFATTMTEILRTWKFQ